VARPEDWIPIVSEEVGPLLAIHTLGESLWRVETDQGALVVKSGPGCGDERDGLRRLGEVPGAPPVPDMVLSRDDLLVTTAIPQIPRHAGHEEQLGRGLALLHRASCPEWGGGSSWIGSCPIDPTVRASGAEFYRSRVIELATRCGLEAEVTPITAKIEELVPPTGPSLLHGDLWWGNVLFGADDRAWLIDPSVHGGHPEEDLAMLRLFGDLPDRVVDTYQDVHPLDSGWRDRVPLFQLIPLLVHTVLFGGGYRAQAMAAARRYR
jgi:fructosamine-3-kinase